MKSLLVDVLREAQNSGDEPGSTPSARKHLAGTSGNGDATAEARDELQILDVESSALLFATSTDARDDDAMLLPILDATDIPDAVNGEVDPLGSTGWLVSSGARLDNPEGWIALIGRWSPAVCIIGMIVAAGANEMLQQLTARRLNADLANVSQQVSNTGRRQDFPIDRPGSGNAFRFNAGQLEKADTLHDDDGEAPADTVRSGLSPQTGDVQRGSTRGSR